jgi:CrcB protein
MIKLLLFVGIGGFFGSISRFAIYQVFLKIAPNIAPSGTLFINVLGCFILGLLMHQSGKLEKEHYLLLAAGFCGGFTTFSTFSAESLRLILDDNIGSAFLYMGLSLVLGLGASALGWYIGKIAG